MPGFLISLAESTETFRFPSPEVEDFLLTTTEGECAGIKKCY